MQISKTKLAMSAVLALCIDMPAMADDVPETQPVVVSVSGVQVAIDPGTGKLRAPDESEAALLAEEFKRRYLDNVQDKPAVYSSDGSVSKQLDTRHRLYTLAVIDKNGQLTTACMSPQAAATALATATRVGQSPRVAP